MINTIHSLAGHLLVAAPAVQDAFFTRSVVYLCAHNESGAMGVIVNYPVQNVHLHEILDQLGIEARQERSLPVHFGGPVESNRGFVVHSADAPAEEECLIRGDGLAVSTSLSVLQDVAQGRGPRQGMLVLGYAGWAPGQLESEIEAGSWIVAPASKRLVLDIANESKWSEAVTSMGIDPGHLSATVGHA